MRLVRTVIQNFPAILRSPIVWSFLGILLVYGLLALVLEKGALLIVANATRLVFSTAVAVAFFPPALVFIMEGRPQRHGYLTIGIWGSWTIEALIGGRTLLNRLLDRPDWLTDWYDISLLVLLSASFAVMHMTARAIREGETHVPSEEWIRTGVLAACGVALAIALIFLISGGHLASLQDLQMPLG